MTDIELMQEFKLYKKIYFCLFNGISDAEKCLSRDEMIDYLRIKQSETEKIYIEKDI